MSNLATITNNILADSGIDDLNVIVSTGSYSNPAWITALAWSKITGSPAFLTSVTASSPLASSGGTTPNITIQQASGSQSGFLSSTDWTTFNNKQDALTNPVTGTGTTNYLPKFTGTSSIGNSIVQDAGIRVDIGGDIRLTPSSAVNIQAYTGSVYTNLFYNAASHNWQTSGGATKMFLNSNDNLLIGTTTDGGQRLQVTGTVGLRASASGSSATQIPIFNADPSGTTRELVTRTPAQLLSDIGGQAALTNPVTGTGTTNYLPKFTGSTTVGNSTLQEVSGNLGLGVTPSAWGSQNTVLQLLNNTSLISRSGFTALARNLFYTTSDVAAYISNDVATNYLQISGEHRWLNAPSGTAGATMTQTQAMTLDSSGNLLIGATSNISSARREIVIRGANGSLLSLGNNTTADRFQIVSDSGENALLNNKASTPMIFYTSNTEAMRISSSQNLLVGTTTDNGARLQVSGAIYSSDELYLDNGKYLRFRRSSGNLSIQTLGIPSGTDDVRLLTTGDFNVLNGSLTNLMTVKNSGNVGIGTTSPSTALHVVSNDNSANRTSPYNVATITATSANAPYNGFGTGLVFASTHYNGLVYNGARIRTVLNDNSIVSLGNSIAFDVTSTRGGALNEAMKIDYNGNVGIGTSSPATRLMVQDSGNTFVGHFSGLNQTNGVAIGTNSLNVAVIQGYTRTFSATNNIALQTDGGNVLIGTTTDSGDKFQVNGTIRLNQGYVQIINTSNAGLYLNNVSTQWQVYNNTSNNFIINNGAGTTALSLTYSTGAATFSSSVQATNMSIGIAPQTDKLFVYNASGTNTGLTIQQDGTGEIFRANGNGGANRLVIQQGGNVGIGTSSPGARTVIATALASSASFNWLTFRNLSGGYGTWGFVKQGLNGLSLNYGTDSDTPNVGSAITFAYGGNVLIGTTTDVGARLYVDGAFRTGTLTAGTQTAAVDWRLGNARGGAATNNALIRVQINGVLVDLLGNYV